MANQIKSNVGWPDLNKPINADESTVTHRRTLYFICKDTFFLQSSGYFTVNESIPVLHRNRI